jgi:hypothetical protein
MYINVLLLDIYCATSKIALETVLMKISTSLCIATLLATPVFGLSLASASTDTNLPLSGWMVIGDKEKAYGPTEEGENITFGGADFAKKGRNAAAFFPKTELAEGETLEFTAKANFNGVSGMGNFRFGIFQKRSKDHPRGWFGYCAYAGIDKHFPKGGLFASEPDNDVSYDKATANVLGESTVPFRNIKDGTYVLTMTLTRSGSAIECNASMAPEGDPSAPIAEYSGTDSAPAAQAFDSLGFNTHELLSADSLSLSDVSVKLIAP